MAAVRKFQPPCCHVILRPLLVSPTHSLLGISLQQLEFFDVKRCVVSFLERLRSLRSNAGLLIALSELVPEFDTFVDVLIARLGQSETRSVIRLR